MSKPLDHHQDDLFVRSESLRNDKPAEMDSRMIAQEPVIESTLVRLAEVRINK
jgi:hypothetical protein